MSEIRCPKCKSDQVSAQKRGFNAGKAVAGVVLTGGVGALAGLHGSNKIEVYCLACGHSWNPITASQREKQEQIRAKQQAYNKSKVLFYKAYESGDKEKAERLVHDRFAHTLKREGLDKIYQQMKSADRQVTVTMTIFIVLLTGLAVWIFS